MIKNINLTDGTNVIDFNESGNDHYFYLSNKYCWIKNTGESDVSVIAEGAETVTISSGESFRVTVPLNNKISLEGAGSVLLITGNEAACPFM